MDSVNQGVNLDSAVRSVELVSHSYRIVVPFCVSQDDMSSHQFIVDTGNPTTIISTSLAQRLGGYKLSVPSRDLSIGAKVAGNINVPLYPHIVPSVYLGSLHVKDMFVYAGDLSGELRDIGLLGLNFLDCLAYGILRNVGKMYFYPVVPDFLPNKARPFSNYFDTRTGEYVCLSEF